LHLLLDNHLGNFGQRNCFWIDGDDFNVGTSVDAINRCGLNVGGWRPWGRRIWISLDLGISDNNRILVGRIFTDRASGTIVFSSFNGEKDIGEFKITAN